MYIYTIQLLITIDKILMVVVRNVAGYSEHSEALYKWLAEIINENCKVRRDQRVSF